MLAFSHHEKTLSRSQFFLIVLLMALMTSTMASAQARPILQLYGIDQINGAEHVLGAAKLKQGSASVFLVNPQCLQWRKGAKFFLRGKDARLYDFEVLAQPPRKDRGQVAVKTSEAVPRSNMFTMFRLRGCSQSSRQP